MKIFQDYDRAVFAGQIIELVDRFLPEHEPHDAVFRLVRMTARALEQGCSIEFAACYFEVWMLRLAGVFPDLFYCSACTRKLEAEDERFLAPGLQAVICSGCDHRSERFRSAAGVGVAAWESSRSRWKRGNIAEERALKNLHELNQYWIRHYFER